MLSSTFQSFALVVSLAVAAHAHIDLNWPQGQYSGTEEQQETGAICGGGVRSSTYGWGIDAGNPFVSVSGDPGQFVTIKLLPGKSDTYPPAVADSVDDFKYTLFRNVVIPESGNLCLNVTKIRNVDRIIDGAMSTIYVQAAADKRGTDAVSACGAISLLRDYPDSSLTAYHNGQPATDESGRELTNYDFFCSNGTIPARAECDCHCHGTEEHCTVICTDQEVADARARCEAEAGARLAF